MRILPSGSSTVRFLGYMIFGFGILSILQYFDIRFRYSQPPDMGIALGSGAIVFTGLVALSVADSLKKLEQRIARLEETRTPRNDQA